MSSSTWRIGEVAKGGLERKGRMVGSEPRMLMEVRRGKVVPTAGKVAGAAKVALAVGFAWNSKDLIVPEKPPAGSAHRRGSCSRVSVVEEAWFATLAPSSRSFW